LPEENNNNKELKSEVNKKTASLKVDAEENIHNACRSLQNIRKLISSSRLTPNTQNESIDLHSVIS
jgi:uncharacterized protein (DUF111 family)